MSLEQINWLQDVREYRRVRRIARPFGNPDRARTTLTRDSGTW